MNIFITGGTGFIGQHVTKQLVDDGHTLLLLCLENEDLSHLSYLSKSVQLLRGDLSKLSAIKNDIKRFQPDAVIHMAWEGIPNYNFQMSTKNLIHSLNLMTMLAEIGCQRILCTGSCWEYEKKTGQMHEDSVVKPSNAFTAAKISFHTMGREIAHENNMKFIWTRLFYVYGPGQKSHSLIPHIIGSIRTGNRLDIKTPHNRNDFIYVEDVAKAISLLIIKNSLKEEVFNIGSGSSTEIIKIINMAYQYYGHKERYTCSDESSSATPTDFWADISRIKTEIGWKPNVSINTGIKNTIEYFKKIS